jgi:hypothetical protein
MLLIEKEYQLLGYHAINWRKSISYLDIMLLMEKEYQLFGYHAINGERVSVTWVSCY